MKNKAPVVRVVVGKSRVLFKGSTNAWEIFQRRHFVPKESVMQVRTGTCFDHLQGMGKRWSE